MVKIIENYILEREIGRGQYGIVFKGVHKEKNTDIAAKSISRYHLKGKLNKLLNNEINVLKKCKNNNIIRLFDIKRSINNIYLILEYCNEGDLDNYLIEKGRLTEEEAVDFFIQIMNAFKTLNKKNIMHRDFKLANILKHNGIIKIADFGFAKLLGDKEWTNTTLGSPITMAPEVLSGKEYNSKADIWSIGICLYQLIYGEEPFKGKNYPDLLNNIKNKKLYFNPTISISPIVQDVLIRMLTVKPNERIDWKYLFRHKINFMLQEKIKNDLQEIMKKEDLLINISKFYINNNKVIDHIADIEKKEDINNFAFQITKKNLNENIDFKGEYLKHNNKRSNKDSIKNDEEINKNFEDIKDMKLESTQNTEENIDITKEETKKEKLIKCFKVNSSKLWHERNKYVFLATVAEDCSNFKKKYNKLLSFILIKKLFFLIENFKNDWENKYNRLNLENWDDYLETKEFNQIFSYILKEYDVFKMYLDKICLSISKILNDPNKKDSVAKEVYNAKHIEIIDILLKNILENYLKNIISNLNKDKNKEIWIHLYQIIDSINQDEIFRHSLAQNSAYSAFNFRLYYEEIKSFEVNKVADLFLKKFDNLYKNY